MSKLPKQVLEADEEANAALAEVEQNAKELQTTVSQSDVQTLPAVGDFVPSLIENVEAEQQDPKELQRYKSAMGRAKKIEEEAAMREAEAKRRVEELEDKLNVLSEENDRLTEENARVKSYASEREYASEEDAQLNEVMRIMNEGVEDGEEYSPEEARKFLRSINAVSDMKLRGLKKDIGEYKQSVAQKRISSFISEVNSIFPGWEEMDRNNDKRWLDFLNTTSPYDNSTYGDKAREAFNRCDVQKLSNIIRTFSQVTGVTFSKNGASMIGADQVRPDGRVGSPRLSVQNKTQVIPRSLAEKFKRAYQSKKWREFGMTDEQAKNFIIQIENAEAYGLIDERK